MKSNKKRYRGHSHEVSAYSTHASRILGRKPAEFAKLTGVFGVVFRPSTGKSTLGDPNGTRLLGTTTMIVLSYELIDGVRRMLLRGFTAQLARDGSVQYVPAERLMPGVGAMYDVALEPGSDHPYALPLGKEDLVELVVQMDHSCFTELDQEHELHTILDMPGILLGFAPNELPEPEVTTAVEEHAAKVMGVEVTHERIKQPDILGQQLLLNKWSENVVFMAADHPDNHTGLTLVNAEFCTQAGKALRVFEDFRREVEKDGRSKGGKDSRVRRYFRGKLIANPARQVCDAADRASGYNEKTGTFRVAKRLRVENPAAAVLRAHGLDPVECRQQQFHNVDPELVPALVLAMGNEVTARGGQEGAFTDAHMERALENPHKPVVAVETVLARVLDRNGSKALVKRFFRDAATEKELAAASANPADGLFVEGGCKTLVYKFNPAISNDCGPWAFPPERLRRRLSVDLWVEPIEVLEAIVDPNELVAGPTGALPEDVTLAEAMGDGDPLWAELDALVGAQQQLLQETRQETARGMHGAENPTAGD